MADFQPSETSTAVAPIKLSSSGESGKEVEDGRGGGDGDSTDTPHRVHDVSTVDGGNANIRGVATVPLDVHNSMQEHSKEAQNTVQLQPAPSQQSSETVTTTAQAHPQYPVPALKRFTSVNINKRFLETTSSSSGISSGGISLTGHSSSNVGAQGQRRGASPAAARSPSTDRPAPSRLVTAKLTAVPQPSAASTAGWLRTNPSAPGSATSTPPSSSPQPTNGAPASHSTQSASSTGVQQSKLRPGELPAQNGVVASNTSSSIAQQGSSKPVWGKVPLPLSNIRGRNTDGQINDFPTAAEAAHGRKTKALNAQLAAETAAAQTAAQKQAMNETAAAFRGVHLDPNAHHWDEMEDEDSDFLAGVIEFGDGTQYKIEHKTEPTPSQEHQSAAPTPDAAQLQSLEIPPISHPHVSKDERFGEDFDRSWPRARTSPVRPTVASSHPPRIAMPPQGGPPHSPTDSPVSTSTSTFSPHDGTSPTSRVLFNERSNRLEPWSSAKPRSGLGQASGSTARRDSREDHPQFGLFRQQGRDAPPHSHPHSSNVLLLQKGVDSAWKGGPPRNFSHAPERGRWGAPSQRDEDRPWETRRRESMSSSDAAGPSAREMSRDRELGRSRWDIGSVDHQQRNWERRPSNTGMPPPPQSLARDKSGDAGRQLPPHLSRMPPPPVPPIRGPEVTPDANTVSQDPTESPSVSVRSMLSPTSEKGPSVTGTEEGIDKDSLVKSAMQLAIERAKKRKQEGEEEEKRRLEAAERARKKAETLAAAQEDMKRAQTLPPPLESKVLEPLPVRDAPQSLPRMNDTEASHKSRDTVDAGAPRILQTDYPLSKGVFSRPQPPRVVNAAPVLRRKPSISAPVQLTPASQADSWRSKAAPVSSSPPPPRPSSPPPLQSSRGALPPTTQGLELDLTLLPDENIEVVDFCDLGKFMGRPPSPASPAAEDSAPAHPPPPASLSTRAKRPVASDFFDDRPSSSSERISPINSDMPSWRRSALKPVTGSPPHPTGEELGTQTMPIFSTDDPAPVKEDLSSAEAKPVSTSSSSPPFNRQSFQNDHGLSTAATQSIYVSSAAVASRSPRTPSYFKEAPMSTLTDTMSRIKGALDGMQSQDPPTMLQPRESKEKEFLDQRFHDFTQSTKTRNTEVSPTSWRERREPRSEVIQQVTKILTPPASRPPPREVFDITHPDPPRSPKPAWNAFIVRLPKESRFRDAISRKQLHFWNLPHPGVRWDILSWEPPVEGMNKRELSRDEIFHRKYAIRGGKLRVSLPNKRIVHHMMSDGQGLSDASSLPVLVTSAGVKIKLPSNASAYKDKTIVASRTVSSSRPRESSVPSWRKSAMPLAQLKHDHRNAPSTNGSPSDYELNTTSRSPPPEPSTPLPKFSASRDSVISSSRPASATVSLPTNSPSHPKASGIRRPSGTNVAFFRSSRGEASAGINGPLPRFTVTSELDRSGESASSPTTDHAVVVTKNEVESTQASIKSLKGSPQIVTTTSEIPLQGLVSSISDNKGSEESASGTRPVTPPSTHNSSAWGKSPLSFSLKESPARSAPDPEHLKAVWSQPSGRTTATTSNSLKGIADDLPSIPFTVQDMKSEDGETPPPTAPAPQPSRLSLQEVTRAFQQVPGAPAPVTSPSSRPPSYAATPLLSSNPQQSFRTPQTGGMSLPPHGVRPIFAPYPQSLIGHSPSPTFMYAPGIASPVAHHRMPLNNASPPITHPMWLPTSPPQSNQAATFMRAGPQPPAPMMYPPPIPGASSGAPGQMVHRRMSVVSPPGLGSNMYHGHPMEMQGHIHQAQAHVQSPHHSHAHPVTHPVHMHQIFSPPPHGQAPAMYAVPVGAGRGGMMPRPAYESIQQVPHLAPHNPSYQPVPPTSFSHPFHS